MTIWTIGHSNRTIDEFLELLRTHGMERLLDVRKIPRSKRNPQFAIDQLPVTLQSAMIEYEHMPSLGGHRSAKPDSINTAWQNESFRGYADHMQSPEFQAVLEHLIELADGPTKTVIMCAEAVPWRCHRSLIADSLMARGVEVRHIMDKREPGLHKMTSFSQVSDGLVTYPGLI